MCRNELRNFVVDAEVLVLVKSHIHLHDRTSGLRQHLSPRFCPPLPFIRNISCNVVDPLYRLEHEQADKRRAASRKTVLTRLTELSDAHGRDDYSANAALRQAMRSRKKKDQEREEEAKVRPLQQEVLIVRPGKIVR